MRIGRWGSVSIALLTIVAVSAPPMVAESEAAIVVCRRKNRIKLRPDACKKKETPVSAAELVASPVVVPAAAFSDDGFVPDSYFFAFGGGLMAGNAQGYGCLKAPVQLPPGATVTAVRWFLMDDDAARTVTAHLRRSNPRTGDTSTLSEVTTVVDGPVIQELTDDTIDDPVVDAAYTYYLTTCLPSSSLRLHGVEIDFTPAGP